MTKFLLTDELIEKAVLNYIPKPASVHIRAWNDRYIITATRYGQGFDDVVVDAVLTDKDRELTLDGFETRIAKPIANLMEVTWEQRRKQAP